MLFQEPGPGHRHAVFHVLRVVEAVARGVRVRARHRGHEQGVRGGQCALEG